MSTVLISLSWSKTRNPRRNLSQAPAPPVREESTAPAQCAASQMLPQAPFLLRRLRSLVIRRGDDLVDHLLARGASRRAAQRAASSPSVLQVGPRLRGSSGWRTEWSAARPKRSRAFSASVLARTCGLGPREPPPTSRWRRTCRGAPSTACWWHARTPTARCTGRRRSFVGSGGLRLKE